MKQVWLSFGIFIVVFNPDTVLAILCGTPGSYLRKGPDVVSDDPSSPHPY
jgi:hypothetical protein